MGHKSRFMFPVPGQKAKELPTRPLNPASLSKARKILGTDKFDVESPAFQGDSSKQWDNRSGISISVSESSTSVTTHDSNLENASGEQDDDAAEPSYGQGGGWDVESDVIPRQTDGDNDLRGHKSTATIGNDYQTDASSIQRRRSNASTIQTHYDRSKVPLSVSQQTSNSAMAKGLPTKVSAVLGIERTPSGPVKKKKPSRLDFSLLRPKSRKGHDGVPPVLGNSYVMRSPSLMSQMSAMIRTPSLREKGQNNARRSTQSPREAAATPRTSQAYLPKGATEADGLRHLYDHYEQVSFGEEPSSPELEYPSPPSFGPSNAEPTPPLTTASTLATPTTTPASPVPNPVIRESKAYSTHSRRDSTGSRNTVTTARSSVAYPVHLSPGNDYASSISSRHTRFSRLSQSSRSIKDSNLQQSSVLSLSDSESDDGAFSDSAPKSSMSSHGDASPHVDITTKAELRKSAIEPPVAQERVSGKKRLSAYSQFNDHLAIPKLNIKHHSARVASSSTLRSSVSSASTATASAGIAAPAYKRASSLSVLSDDSGRPISSATYDSAYLERRRTDYGIHEAKVVALTPLGSSAKSRISSPATPTSMECTGSEIVPKDHPQLNEQQRRNSDQLTPPLSPKSLDFIARPPDSPTDSVPSLDGDGLNARFMAVTKQEEMLLAALRKKRAMMRENIIAELEVGRNSVASHRTTSSSGASYDATRGVKTADTVSRLLEAPSLHSSQFPARNSSLSVGVKDLTERHSSTPFPRDSKFDDLMGSPDVPLPLTPRRSAPIQRRDEPALDSSTANYANVPEEDDQVLKFLNSSLSAMDAIDTSEPCPDIGEFMSFMDDSDDEIPLEGRQSRSDLKSSISRNSPVPYDGRRGSERSRANSAVFAAHRSHLENLPEWTGEELLDEDGEYYFDYDFAELAGDEDHTNVESGIARPDSPVSELLGQMLNRKRIQSNSALRISAVGPMVKQPFEVALWGHNG